MFSGMNQTTSPALAPHHMALIPPERLAEIQKQYFEELAHLATNPNAIEIKDRRFAGQAWHSAWSKTIAASYLLNSKHLLALAHAVDTDEKSKHRIVFATEQMIDAMSPSNFIATNPEVLENIISSQGQSIQNGISNLLGDLKKGKVSQTDETAFEIGKNLATTEGAVVFRNDLFELIQYTPLTETVYERPLLMVPPCINKYYILDLQPDNSVVRYLVEQGHTIFLVSWKNPDDSMSQVTWDDYVGKGVIQAIEVAKDIGGTEQINVLGFCVGGTLTASALAVLAARKKKLITSLTLLTTLLDFSDTGILDIFVDEGSVKLRENTIGGEAGNFGMMSGLELGNTFSFLRPNDLVWNYVVGNYLKGESPPAFDLLYWNGDATNLPGPLYAWYLRNMYLENRLKEPQGLEICDVRFDLSKLDLPIYIYGSKEDHIVPIDAAYASTQIFKGKKRFVMGASGHIAGVINPPQARKRSHWVSTKSTFPKQFKDWEKSSHEIPGSWWDDWSAWLKPLAGQMLAAPKKAGNKSHPPLMSAPGNYVAVKV